VRIIVNGEPREVRENLTIDRLLEELAVRRDYTGVALNREIVSRTSYPTTVLREGDRVEIVRPMSGGA
jgi:thiamine biosynthesis protein ThiS